MTAAERWLPVVGWEGYYEVSDRGLVRSIARLVPSNPGVLLRVEGRELAGMSDRLGYQNVNLCRAGKHVRRKVHRLVAAAFLGPCPPGGECRHLDGSRDNNVPSNLRWGSRSENELDKVEHGTHQQSSKTHCRWGHPFDETNTRWISGHNWRACRTCERNRIRPSTREQPDHVHSPSHL